MVDVKEDKLTISPAAEAVTIAPAPENPKSAAKGSFTATHTISKGEKIFEWTVYRGLNYWVNLTSSVIFTDWFKNLGGREKLRVDKLSEFLAKHMPGSKPYERKLSFAFKTFNYLALTSGGTALVWPLKTLEANKRKVVHWINDKLGIDQTAPDGHKLTSDEIYIEKEQPPSSWFNVIWRRGLGMLSVAAGGHLIDQTFKTAATHGDQVVTDFVLKSHDGKGGVNRVLNSGYIPGGKFLAKNERTQAWMGFAVLDSIFTQLTAFIMLVTNGAKKKQMPREIEECAPVADAAAAKPADDISLAKDLADLKAKKPQPVGSYTDAVQQRSSTDLAMAP